MLRSIYAVLALAVLATAALAAPRWNGAGWYQVEDADGGPWIWAGPFESEATCNATLPEEDEGTDYFECWYLETQPTWDY